MHLSTLSLASIAAGLCTALLPAQVSATWSCNNPNSNHSGKFTDCSAAATAAVGICGTGNILNFKCVSQTGKMPQPSYGNTFTASLTRGFFFQCPVDCRIDGLLVPNENNHPAQVVEVLDFGSASPPAWPNPGPPVAQLFYDNSTPADEMIFTSIPLTAGNWYGILGACNPSQGSATSANSYGTPSGAFTSDILGNPVQIARFGTQSGIASNGGNTGLYWTETGGPIGRVCVFICQAQWEQQGDGCPHTAPPFASLGTPDLTALNPPTLGNPFAIACQGAPGGVAFMITGISTTFSANFGALPFVHPAAPGCPLRVSDDAVGLMTSLGSTTAGWAFLVPNDPNFCGLTYHYQAITPSPGTNPLGWVISNAYSARFGN